jgi:hypothetical protein
MSDNDITRHIEDLVKEEHALLERGDNGMLTASEAARLEDVNVRLDQYWDLLRQRRARRDAGQDPEAAQMRPAKVVERYQQ